VKLALARSVDQLKTWKQKVKDLEKQLEDERLAHANEIISLKRMHSEELQRRQRSKVTHEVHIAHAAPVPLPPAASLEKKSSLDASSFLGMKKYSFDDTVPSEAVVETNDDNDGENSEPVQDSDSDSDSDSMMNKIDHVAVADDWKNDLDTSSDEEPDAMDKNISNSSNKTELLRTATTHKAPSLNPEDDGMSLISKSGRKGDEQRGGEVINDADAEGEQASDNDAANDNDDNNNNDDDDDEEEEEEDAFEEIQDDEDENANEDGALDGDMMSSNSNVVAMKVPEVEAAGVQFSPHQLFNRLQGAECRAISSERIRWSHLRFDQRKSLSQKHFGEENIVSKLRSSCFNEVCVCVRDGVWGGFEVIFLLTCTCTHTHRERERETTYTCVFIF
jgi:hypothetical protein